MSHPNLGDSFSGRADFAGSSFFDSLAIQDANYRENMEDIEQPEGEQPSEGEYQENSQTQQSQDGDQPSMEKIQDMYYTKGLEELESLQLLDLSPLATWKLSSHKQGFGLEELRNDSPSTYWQSDGSTDNNMDQRANVDGNQLSHPHHINLQFSKKVSLERISIFTNYQLDESYTPLKIKIMAGGSNWDLTEVCVVDLDKPIGWSHIIFKGVRADGLLKCFVLKIIILANHQDGKDSHIRAIRCFGKKLATSSIDSHLDISALRDTSVNTGHSSMSGILLNHLSMEHHRFRMDSFEGSIEEENEEEEVENDPEDPTTARILTNVADVIGFNSGFDSLTLKSVSSIR